jgi:hypothetical protein
MAGDKAGKKREQRVFTGQGGEKSDFSEVRLEQMKLLL